MISSKLFTTLLRYKINENTYEETCEQLLEKLKDVFENNVELKYLIGLVTAEYVYKVDRSEKPFIEIIVLVYATIDSKVESNKILSKLFGDFVERHCEELDGIDSKLVSMEVV